MRGEIEQGQLSFRRLEGGAAAFANGAHQALAHNRDEGRGNQERLDPHVDQPGDGAGGIVGVEGAQNQVAGEGGLNGNLRRLQVAHFTDHNHVRVLPQERAQGPAEGQADGLVDGDLHDAFQVVFDRVFGSEQLGVNGVDAPQAGVEGGGFAAAGRPGSDEDAIGPLHGFGDVIVKVLGEAQRIEFKVDGGTIQHAQHHRFTELGWEGRNAQIDRAITHGETDAPVLGQAALGDVEVGHDLETGNHRQGQMLGRRRHFVERAVHAIADAELGFKGLEMNVAGAVLHGLEHDQVDEANDRRFVGQPFHQRHVVGGLYRPDFVGNFLVLAQLFEDVGDVVGVFGVISFDGFFDLRGVRHDQLNVLVDDKAQFVEPGRI